MTWALFVARPCQHVGAVLPLQLLSPSGPSSLPCLGAGPLATHKERVGTESSFVSAAAGQRDASWAAFRGGLGGRILLSAMVGRVGAVLCGAPAAQAGWLICVKVSVSVSVFKMALARLLLWSVGDGFPGTEVA